MASPALADLIALSRPRLVTAASLLFFAGALLAVLMGARWSTPQATLGFLIFLTAILSIPYSNDYFDASTDVPGESTPYSGGTGVLLEHPELRQFAYRASLAMISMSIALALVYTLVRGDGIRSAVGFLSFVLAGNALAWFYSAPPARLGFRGVGEVATAIGIGFMTPGLGYLSLAGTVDGRFLLFSLPLMAYGMGTILSVQLPDMEADRAAGKNTFVARKGRRVGAAGIAAAFLLATVCFVLLSLDGSLIPGIDFRPMAIISLLPSGAGLLGLTNGPGTAAWAGRAVRANVASLFVLVLIADAYLFYLIAHRGVA